MEILVKKCSGPCELILELNSINFYRDKYHKTGFDSRCKICSPIKKESSIIVENNITYQISSGECKLKLELSNDNFEWTKRLNKFTRQCRICLLIYSAKYYEENREKVLLQTKIRQSKPENRKKHNERRKQKRLNDPEYRLMNDISKMVFEMLKNHKTSKNKISSKKYLPFTKEELKIHIESLFKPWMNWNNQGVYKPSEWDDNDTSTWVWQLDHIIPQADLKYDSMEHPNFKLCWDLNNLRPLRADLNHEDGVKRTRHK